MKEVYAAKGGGWRAIYACRYWQCCSCRTVDSYPNSAIDVIACRNRLLGSEPQSSPHKISNNELLLLCRQSHFVKSCLSSPCRPTFKSVPHRQYRHKTKWVSKAAWPSQYYQQFSLTTALSTVLCVAAVTSTSQQDIPRNCMRRPGNIQREVTYIILEPSIEPFPT